MVPLPVSPTYEMPEATVIFYRRCWFGIPKSAPARWIAKQNGSLVRPTAHRPRLKSALVAGSSQGELF